jgi:hypothetical protein
MDKNDAAPMGEDELLRAQSADDEDASAPAEEPDGDDTFDLEADGRIHTLPGALKGAFLRQADYTRKTQELAAHRRALEAERAAVASHAQVAGQASADQVQLAALDHQLAELHGVDWQGFAAHDPHAAQALWTRFQAMAQAREGLAQALSHHAARRQLQAARDAAQRMAQTGQVLAREIEGWSPETAGKLVDYAQTHGVTLDELGAADDPRVWKILHRAWQADQASQKEGAAKTAVQAQAVRPAVLVSGAAAGGGGVRDELATKEWMKRRNDAVRRGR